jgi:hypothetical protein
MTERNTFALWYAVLGGPAAALTSVSINYAAVSRACVQENVWLLHAFVIACLLISGGALMTGIAIRRKLGGGDADDGYGIVARSKFMAVLGILTATVSIFGLVLQWIPVFYLGPCNGA